MPFDGTGFPERQQPARRPSKPSDTVVGVIIVALAFSMLVMPISLTALVDIVHYLRQS